MITLFGSGIGPATLTPLAIGSDGKVSNTLAETQVLFDGVAAPLIYVSAAQVSAIVPYGVAGKSTTLLQVSYRGLKSNTLTVPVASCAPALFTADSSGKGQAAIANQDNSYNSRNNPADKGSIITFYATGEGQTDPPGVDGQLALAVYPKPVLPVSQELRTATFWPLNQEHRGANSQNTNSHLRFGWNCAMILPLYEGKREPLATLYPRPAQPAPGPGEGPALSG